MKRKFIGSAELVNGHAEYNWVLDDSIKRGSYKVYISYLENDGYLSCEAWENALIKSPVSLIFEPDNITLAPNYDYSNPIRVLLRVRVKDLETLTDVDGGEVQFFLKASMGEGYKPVNNPVVVHDGVAELTCSIPYNDEEEVFFKAVYLSNDVYSECETSVPCCVHIKQTVNIQINNIITSPGSEELLNIIVTNGELEQISEGVVKVYVDNVYLDTRSVTGQMISVPFTVPSGASGGNHNILVEFSSSNHYYRTVYEGSFFVKCGVVIDDTPSYSRYSYVDDDGVEHIEQAVIPVKVCDVDGNAVSRGSVELVCLGTTQTLTLDDDGRCNGVVTIPLGYHGEDEIPYTVTYHANDYYLEAFLESRLIFKSMTSLIIDPVDGSGGEEVTLTAHVTDEQGKDVDTGEVTFEMGEDGESDSSTDDGVVDGGGGE